MYMYIVYAYTIYIYARVLLIYSDTAKNLWIRNKPIFIHILPQGASLELKIRL